MIAGLYAAIAGIFLIYLSVRVIGLRRGKRISVGPAGDAELERAMRVHGNFVEYAPLGLLLLIVAEMNGLAAPAVHALGLALIAGRFIHFLGFRSPEAPGVFRVGGMATTFTVIALLAVIVAYQYAAGALSP